VLSHFLIAIALSMDAFAVSVSASLCMTAIPLAIALRAAFAFGFFQFGMPLLGWFLGSSFRTYIEHFDHWIAFGLLGFVGVKMIIEGIRSRDPAACPDPDEDKSHGIMRLDTLAVLAIATSIDAMAIGLSYNILGTPMFWPAVLIGVTTFTISMAGLEFGKTMKHVLEEWAEILGGSVLVIIGLKILIEHLLKGV